jgi:hypothetical protein
MRRKSINKWKYSGVRVTVAAEPQVRLVTGSGAVVQQQHNTTQCLQHLTKGFPPPPGGVSARLGHCPELRSVSGPEIHSREWHGNRAVITDYTECKQTEETTKQNSQMPSEAVACKLHCVQ